MLLHNLWISTAMVGATVFLHFVGLAALIAVLNTNLPDACGQAPASRRD